MHLPRYAELWGASYLQSRARRLLAPGEPKRAWLLIADHYEPLWNNPTELEALRRVNLWAEHWPRIAADCPRDSSGNQPVYTMFYPQEEYRPELLQPLAEMARNGIADVEVHIHHDGEGRENFVSRVSEFCKALYGNHGLLRREEGKLRFAFIHGNWALDNSRPDGRFCGLNDEITLLRELGCYADFTMPSGNHPTQSRLVNTIYWCTDDPNMPRSFDSGELARPGGGRNGDLLMVPGPLGLRWAERLVPRLETGEIAGNDPPTPYRVRRWFDLAPRLGRRLFHQALLSRHSAAKLRRPARRGRLEKPLYRA